MPQPILVLDTHAWIWLMNGEAERLSTVSQTAIRQSSETGNIGVAAISVWEEIRISQDAGRGKMIQAAQKLTFDEFLELRPEDGRYELIDGKLVRILATRQHDNVAEFISDILKEEVKRLKLNYRVSGRVVIATSTSNGTERGRHPDVSVVDRTIYDSNLLAYSALREPIQLAVEVVSTNWEDDYVDKLDEYQRMGIQEFWIVDYLAVASRAYLGNPKDPTVFVYQLIDSTYQVRSFTGSVRIVSPTFNKLELTVDQVFASGT